jgi:hypothetical protein
MELDKLTQANRTRKGIVGADVITVALNCGDLAGTYRQDVVKDPPPGFNAFVGGEIPGIEDAVRVALHALRIFLIRLCTVRPTQ